MAMGNSATTLTPSAGSPTILTANTPTETPLIIRGEVGQTQTADLIGIYHYEGGTLAFGVKVGLGGSSVGCSTLVDANDSIGAVPALLARNAGASTTMAAITAGVVAGVNKIASLILCTGAAEGAITAFRRWGLRKNSAAESGSNAGSDFQIESFDDNGTSLGFPLKLTRSTGDASFDRGDVLLSVVGKGLRVKEGTNAKQGLSAAMVAGTLLISNTSVTANSRIQLTRQAGGTNAGAVFESARVAGTSFTVTSTNAADTGQVAFHIYEPA